VQPILNRSCALAGCHAGPRSQENLDLSARHAYAALVNVDSRQCPGAKRVVAGKPDASYLTWKLTGSGPCFRGLRMPPAGGLAAPEIDVLRSWMAHGARDD
jgi:hypothetical protein